MGCASESTESAATESEVNALKVTFEGTGDALSVEDSPKLKAGAEGALACGTRFEFDGRRRITCTRGEEKLEVIVRPAEGDGAAREGLLVHKPKASADKEQFFACKVSGTGPDGLPKKLDCKNAPLRDRPSHGGGLASPFDSTVPEISIPNAHAVGPTGKLFRSMAPGSPEELDELLKADVGAVLIFKNVTTSGHDVGEEIAELVQRGLPESRVKNIEFKWKDIGPFKEPCEQTIEALKFLKTNLSADRKTLFHCTVGEDRTGFLAAIHRMLTEKLDAGVAWDGDMCERGYGAGNPLKPGFVVGTLEGSLKPLYRKMAFLAAQGRLDSLDTSVCASDPSEDDEDFETKALPLDRLTCGTSTRFVP